MTERKKSSMDRIITRLFTFGLTPLGFTGLGFMVASRVFLWSRHGAMLWGIGAGLIVLGLGLSPCKRFLEAGDHRAKEPHEVGRFMMRLLWLHALGALGFVLAYVELDAALQKPWLALAGGICASAVSYLVLTWIFFAAKDPQ